MKISLMIFLSAIILHAESVYDRVLYKALWATDTKKAMMAIKKGADVQKIRYHNMESIPFVSIKLLVDNGYNLNNKKEDGCLLSEVFRKRDTSHKFYETVEYLLSKGANPNCLHKFWKSSVLYEATSRKKIIDEKSFNNEAFLKAYKLLLEKSSLESINGYVKVNSDKKQKALAVAFGNNIFDNFRKRAILLIDHGTALNKPIRVLHKRSAFHDLGYRYTYPVFEAIRHNDLDLVKKLLKKGVDINEDYGRSFTLVDYAHSLKRDDMEMYLLEHGAKYQSYHELN